MKLKTKKKPTKNAKERESWPKDVIVTLEPRMADARGFIQPLVETTMRSALLIQSNKGTIRANHFHKTDWHYCYVLSGSMEYFQRPEGSSLEPERFLVKAGQMVFTPPLVEHANRFLEDTVLLVLSRNPRDQSAYEQDVIRTKLID